MNELIERAEELCFLFDIKKESQKELLLKALKLSHNEGRVEGLEECMAISNKQMDAMPHVKL